MLISVYPRKEARDVVELREGYYRLVELDFAACDEFALKDPVVDLFMESSLRLREGGSWLVSLEDNIKISK